MEKNGKKKDPALTIVAIGAGVTFTGIFIGGALQYLYHILLARYLGPDKLGIFVLGITVVTIASSFSRLGFDLGILRYAAMYRGAGDTARVKGTVIEALKLSGITSIIVSVLLFLLSSHISNSVFHRQELAPVLKILSFTVPFFALMGLFLVACQAFYVARYTALVKNVIYPLMNILFAFSALLLGWRVLGVAVTYLISTVIAFILAGYFLLKLFPEIKAGFRGIADRKELLKFSVPLLGASFLTYLVLWTDTLMLGFFKSSHDVGIYSAAAKTSMLLLFLLLSFNVLFVPRISDLYNKKDIERLERMFKTVTRWAFTLAFPAFLFMVSWPGEILHIFGDSFLVASTPLIILALGQFANVSTGSVGSMLVMTGRNWLVLLYSSLTFGLNLILNYILIPRYGIVGAAVATASSISLINILYLMTVYRLMRIHPYHINIFKPVLGGIVALGLTKAVVHRITLAWEGTLVLSLIILIGLYIFILILLRFNEDDKTILKDVKERVWNKLNPL